MKFLKQKPLLAVLMAIMTAIILYFLYTLEIYRLIVYSTAVYVLTLGILKLKINFDFYIGFIFGIAYVDEEIVVALPFTLIKIYIK